MYGNNPFVDPGAVRRGGYSATNPYDPEKKFLAMGGAGAGRYPLAQPGAASQGVGALLSSTSAIPRKPGLSGLPYEQSGQYAPGAPIAGQQQQGGLSTSPYERGGKNGPGAPIAGQYTPQMATGSAPDQGYNGSLPPSPVGPNDNYRGSGNNPYAYGGFNYNQDYGQQRYQYR